MTAKQTVRHLVGRTITKATPRAFRNGRGGWAHDWLLILDDGSHLTFTALETEVGEYGVAINIHHGEK